MKRRLAVAIFVAGTAMIGAAPATAQKSKDTLRIAINNPFTVLSPYHLPLDEAGNFYYRTHESLIGYDEREGKWVPLLATSWTRVNPRTLEFELRKNVKFHNGNPFDADDVVNTVDYLIDPKLKIRYKGRYDWIERAEKVGSHTVRITAREPTAVDLGLIAYRFKMLDAETQRALEDKADYGRVSPVGTGIYKVATLDKNEGIVVERYDGYVGNTDYTRAPIGRIHGIPMPDRQTQAAELLTGGVEVLRNVIPDQAKDLEKNPDIGVTNVESGMFTYMVFDSVGLSGNEALADPRVRRAIFHAIDRDALIKHVIPGGAAAKKLEAPCWEGVVACQYTKTAAGYDPAAAKKLLAEAGYPDGFSFEYDAYTPIKDVAIAIAGQLREVGIEVKVNPVTIGVYRRKQGQNELNAWSVFFPLGTHPDVHNALSVFFSGKKLDYFGHDEVIVNAMKTGLHELDPEKRAAIYEKAIDRAMEQSYVLPISTLPTVYAHSKDVAIKPNQLSATETYITDFVWK